MANRRTQDSDFDFNREDDPIGLTSAFAPTKGPQSVEYDKGDNAIGLTGAFAPIRDVNEPNAWDEAGKWKDYDWSSYKSEDADSDEKGADDQAEEAPSDKADQDVQASDDAASAAATAKPSSSGKSSGPKHGRHAAPEAAASPRMRQSRRTRRVLIVIVILVILAIAALGYFMFRTISSSQEEAVHQAQEQVDAPKENIAEGAADNAGENARPADVPSLAPLLGLTTDEAIAKIGRGAIVTANREVKEEGNPITASLNVALTEEPVDSKTGSPTVYLGLNKDGRIIQVGYSASASALGFGSLSFADAVNGDHAIEKTLAKIGVEVPEGSAVLPDDKTKYTTFAEDGSTVTRERCSFEGPVDVNGVPCTWSSVLSYDYTTQVVTGNLSDTVRIIYVYVTQRA